MFFAAQAELWTQTREGQPRRRKTQEKRWPLRATRPMAVDLAYLAFGPLEDLHCRPIAIIAAKGNWLIVRPS